jgi:multicomponent Na+:H+ antiporter subunit G
MHAVTKPQVLGLVLLLTAVGLRVRSWPAITLLVLVIIFQLLTGPVAAHMVGRAAYRRRDVPRSARGPDAAASSDEP